MAEKRGKEEYQLPEEEDLEPHYEEEEVHTEGPQKAPFSVKSILLSKKIWVPLFIILGIYGLYKFMEFRDRQQLKAPQVEQPRVVETPKPAPEVVIPPQPVPQPQPAPQPNVVPKVEVQQPTLEQANKTQAQIESLGSQLNQMQLTQTQMNGAVNELSEAIKGLTAKLAQPKVPAVEPQPCLQPKPVKKVKKRIKRYHGWRRIRVIRPMNYHIRAVVPGRAWLVSSAGELFTVRVGDRIVGFGVVEDIDVVRGVIITSSGREITYGKYDS